MRLERREKDGIGEVEMDFHGESPEDAVGAEEGGEVTLQGKEADGEGVEGVVLAGNVEAETGGEEPVDGGGDEQGRDIGRIYAPEAADREAVVVEMGARIDHKEVGTAAMDAVAGEDEEERDAETAVAEGRGEITEQGR